MQILSSLHPLLDTHLVQDDQQIQDVPIAICLKFLELLNIMFIINVKILTLIKWLYWSPQLCWLLNPE